MSKLYLKLDRQKETPETEIKRIKRTIVKEQNSSSLREFEEERNGAK